MENSKAILDLLKESGEQESIVWLHTKIAGITKFKSIKDLFMTYSLLASKFDASVPISSTLKNENVTKSFVENRGNLLEAARIYLLVKVLEIDAPYYGAKVANIIEVADTSELRTFLKYLILLPNAKTFKWTAVEALRTNIAIIFDAITLNNPYPAKYFNQQQWNQMYLKAAFMERDLSMIRSIEERANKDLARIISDYAHERWAASRMIDPMFWRPVAKFIDDTLIYDMERLLESRDIYENRAGALCCFYADNTNAKALLNNYPELENEIASKKITWSNLKMK